MKNPEPTIADRIRELLERLGKLLNPQPKLSPQPIPVRTTRRKE